MIDVLKIPTQDQDLIKRFCIFAKNSIKTHTYKSVCVYLDNEFLTDYGGFQLVDLIIPELKDNMACYRFKCSHW